MVKKAAKGIMLISSTINPKTTAKRGFTLVEILVVVFIVALMATAAGGLYMGTFQNMQLEKCAKE